MYKEDIVKGGQAAFPTVIGYLSIGLAFGIVASDVGMTAWQTGLSSLLIYSGSGQFALVAFLASQASLTSIALTVGLVNLRHVLINLHTATLFQETSLWQQVLIGSFTTDESYGLLVGQSLKKEAISPFWMYGNNFASYLSWFLGTTLGNLLGNLLPDPTALGVDFALVAMFVAIFSGQFDNLRSRLPLGKIGLILLTVTVTYLLAGFVLSGSLAVLLATILACLVGVLTND